MKSNNFINTLEQIASSAVSKGIIHLSTTDNKLINNNISINDNQYVNFGSCSYLGLEFDERIINGAKKALDDYGSQFSSSRAYVSPRHYAELEEKLDVLFNGSTLVTPTTTLGHIAAIPIVVGSNDVVILDHQVHNSVQTAAALVKAKGIKVELVRHNRMDLLEKKILEYKGEYDNIWYMADGIYSMYGDSTPVDEVYQLMDKYKQFRFYVDDAHGMSCYGENGRGFVLANKEMHPQMILATSFAKAFATGGGVLVFPNEEMKRKVKSFGGPMITSGPMQPSALGAAIASADIHLSGEIKELQEDLQENIKYAHLQLKKHNLPNLSNDFSPIFFVGVGIPKVGYNLVNKLMKEGFFLNLGIFPAVPIKNTGIRFTITRLHTFEQIEEMIEAMAKYFPIALAEEDYTREQIYKAFKLEMPVEVDVNEKSLDLSKNLDIIHKNTILDVREKEWNSIFGNSGAFDWRGLNLLENSFEGNEKIENRWDFDYIIIKDEKGKIVLATFLTTSLSKDDMLSPREISEEIEQIRKKDPYYFTSNTLQVGSLLTEGEHLYIDKQSPYWENAMKIFLNRMSEIQESNKASSLIIRDMSANDINMDHFMLENGFFKVDLPNNNKIVGAKWQNDDELIKSLSKRSKKHFKQDVLKHKDKFDVSIKSEITDEDEIQKYYELYLNVKSNDLSMNTFNLPFSLFRNICLSKDWEIISLKSKLNQSDLSVCFCQKGKTEYTFMLIGMDYTLNSSHKIYKQSIYRVLSRGRELGYENINLRYTTDIEKRKFGAKQIQSCAYMQVKDNYNMESLNSISVSNSNKKTKI